MNKMKNYPNKTVLEKMYIAENQSAKEISIVSGLSIATINRLLKKYDIKKTELARRANISKTKQAKTQEEKIEYSKHISEARKGKGIGVAPWNKGKHGLQVAWNKGAHTQGRPRTAESLEKARQTCREKYGVDWACQRQEARFKGHNSGANLEFEQLLKNANVAYTREFPIKNYSYDFQVGKYLIEINPYTTHNSSWGIRDNLPKDANYHKNKSKLAAENGYFCIHVFDWDDKEKIINKLIPLMEIKADDCCIKEPSRKAAYDFLDAYHPQNHTNAQKIIGLYHNDELVELMTFAKPRYNKKYAWEITRVCAKKGLRIIGGCEKILDAFKKDCSPANIIVYCDLAKLSGALYENLGFKKTKNAQPAKHWYNPKVKQHITESFLWKKGFDRLFGTNYGKTASNDRLMLEHGFVEIYDCGQAAYVWENAQ